MVPSDFPHRTTFWNDGSPVGSPLSDDIDVDVAVVGGGFVGLSSALALQDADPSRRIALLEAEYVGFGASGRGSGMVVPFLHSIGSVARAFGWEEARWAARYLVSQAGELKDFLLREPIECDYRPSPLIMAAVDDSQATWLKSRSDELRRGGYEIEILGPKRLGDLLGYRTTAGITVHDENFAQVQPYALAQGFAAAAKRMGVQLYENTLVQSYVATPDRVELTTREGAKVTARKLVLAAGARIRQLGWGRFHLLPISVHSYLLATEQLDRNTLDELGAGLASACVLDASPSFYYLRTYQSRLVIGGAGALGSRADAAADRNLDRYRTVLAEMHRRFPFLKDRAISAAWAGPIQSNLTELPMVLTLPKLPNVVVNIAYVNGVPLSYLAGRLIVDLVFGPSYADSDVVRLRRIFAGTRPSPLGVIRVGLSMLNPARV